MRKMVKGNQKINVFKHIILENFWEYYVYEIEDADIQRALVLGFETEFGDFSMKEIEPYIMSKTNDLKEVLPAPGWEWEDK